MGQFRKAVVAVCEGCYIMETIHTASIKEAKTILDQNYGWRKVEGIWMCAECVERSED